MVVQFLKNYLSPQTLFCQSKPVCCCGLVKMIWQRKSGTLALPVSKVRADKSRPKTRISCWPEIGRGRFLTEQSARICAAMFRSLWYRRGSLRKFNLKLKQRLQSEDSHIRAIMTRQNMKLKGPTFLSSTSCRNCSPTWNVVRMSQKGKASLKSELQT